MKNNIFLLTISILFTISCSDKKQNQLVGHWQVCLKSGHYQEHIFTENKIYVLDEGTTAKYAYFQKNDSLFGYGLSKNTLRGDTFRLVINIVSSSRIILSNQLFEYKLEKLEGQDELPTATIEDEWDSKTLSSFSLRMENKKCIDIRTDEEKNPITELGVLEDNYDELLDLEPLPKWASKKFLSYEKNYDRNYKLIPNYLEGDFTGDCSLDIAIFVSKKSNEKKGILFLFGESDSTFLAGAGNSFEKIGDNFDWVEYWEVFDQQLIKASKILEKRDINGTQKVKLEQVAVHLVKNESFGGLIYYDREKFIWINLKE